MAMEVFDAVAQPKRREILRLLAGRELSAGEIASHFSVTQPAISQHLKVLKEVGLLSERREGTRRVLSVRAEGLEDLHNFLAEVLPTLEALRGAVESYRMAIRAEDRPKKAAEGSKHRGAGATEKMLSVTVSIGAAGRSERAPTPHAVIKAADEALYRAKKAGRNRVSK